MDMSSDHVPPPAAPTARLRPRTDRVRLAALVLNLLVIVLLGVFAFAQLQAVTRVRHELQGLSFVSPLAQLVAAAHVHENALRAGAAADTLRTRSAEQARQAVNQIVTLSRQYPALALTPAASALQQDWQVLGALRTPARAPGAGAGSGVTHDQFLSNRLRNLVLSIGTNAALVFDPATDTNRMSELLMDRVPGMTEVVANSRERVQALAARPLSPEDRLRLGFASGQLLYDTRELTRSLNSIVQDGADHAATVGAAGNAVVASTARHAQLLDNVALGQPVTPAFLDTFGGVAAKADRDLRQFVPMLYGELTSTLESRLWRSELLLALAVLALIALIVVSAALLAALRRERLLAAIQRDVLRLLSPKA